MLTSSRNYITFRILHVYHLFAELKGSIGDNVSIRVLKGRLDHFTSDETSIKIC
jgi:hypothetical protein